MSITKPMLLEYLRKVDGLASEPFTLVGIGGTSLALQNIKQTTYDVDIMVAKGTYESFVSLRRRVPDIRHVDSFRPGKAVSVLFPPDYLESSIHCRSYHNIELFALSVVDVIITKSARLESKDFADIEMCRKRDITGRMVIDRLGQYQPTDKHLDKIRIVLKDMFKVPDGEMP